MPRKNKLPVRVPRELHDRAEGLVNKYWRRFKLIDGEPPVSITGIMLEALAKGLDLVEAELDEDIAAAQKVIASNALAREKALKETS